MQDSSGAQSAVACEDQGLNDRHHLKMIQLTALVPIARTCGKMPLVDRRPRRRCCRRRLSPWTDHIDSAVDPTLSRFCRSKTNGQGTKLCLMRPVTPRDNVTGLEILQIWTASSRAIAQASCETADRWTQDRLLSTGDRTASRCTDALQARRRKARSAVTRLPTAVSHCDVTPCSWNPVPIRARLRKSTSIKRAVSGIRRWRKPSPGVELQFGKH